MEDIKDNKFKILTKRKVTAKEIILKNNEENDINNQIKEDLTNSFQNQKIIIEEPNKIESQNYNQDNINKAINIEIISEIKQEIINLNFNFILENFNKLKIIKNEDQNKDKIFIHKNYANNQENLSYIFNMMENYNENNKLFLIINLPDIKKNIIFESIDKIIQLESINNLNKNIIKNNFALRLKNENKNMLLSSENNKFGLKKNKILSQIDVNYFINKNKDEISEQIGQLLNLDEDNNNNSFKIQNTYFENIYENEELKNSILNECKLKNNDIKELLNEIFFLDIKSTIQENKLIKQENKSDLCMNLYENNIKIFNNNNIFFQKWIFIKFITNGSNGKIYLIKNIINGENWVVKIIQIKKISKYPLIKNELFNLQNLNNYIIYYLEKWNNLDESIKKLKVSFLKIKKKNIKNIYNKDEYDLDMKNFDLVFKNLIEFIQQTVENKYNLIPQIIHQFIINKDLSILKDNYNSTFFLITEKMDGNLAEYFSINKNLSSNIILEILNKIMLTLNILEICSIMHGDMHWSNLGYILDKDDPNGIKIKKIIMFDVERTIFNLIPEYFLYIDIIKLYKETLLHYPLFLNFLDNKQVKNYTESYKNEKWDQTTFSIIKDFLFNLLPIFVQIQIKIPLSKDDIFEEYNIVSSIFDNMENEFLTILNKTLNIKNLTKNNNLNFIVVP